ncbi:unnamed protein product [Cylindrotheca closterium]|uniref:Carbohydrate kinase PfkB domain-containing protein n=1 Tax=Cylindrotheca closterium TaxID=2856 RepID=A0AAD2FX86_9STRA|nr:unnamed protein product [Cylindrotheca closterium]
MMNTTIYSGDIINNTTTEKKNNNNNNDDDDNDQKSSFVVLGDAFADLVCHLDGPFPKEAGGDTRLEHPITTMAGGSGLNTCTHLCSLVSAAELLGRQTVSLYTAVNESDPYGMLLCNHAQEQGFDLHNCHPDASNSSTGHCAVLVANGERSFLTHLGVMETFEARHIDTGRLTLSSSNQKMLFVHVAGYYNIPGFWDGALKRTLQTIIQTKMKEGGGGGGGGDNKNLVTSLLCQYDATEAWDGQLMDLLPLIDYLFCNEVEVEKIAQATTMKSQSQESPSSLSSSQQHQQVESSCMEDLDSDDESYWIDMARFFQTTSPSTCVIVTLGPKGALALYGGQILARQEAPTSVENPLDPTGAGDAFISGFLYGLFVVPVAAAATADSLLEDSDTATATASKVVPSRKESVQQALQYGCAVGTSCISRMGASNPAPRGEIDELMKKYHS